MQIDDVSKIFLYIKKTQKIVMDKWVFFSNVVFVIKCAIFVLKIGRMLNANI
jgi:hypothetical protein